MEEKKVYGKPMGWEDSKACLDRYDTGKYPITPDNFRYSVFHADQAAGLSKQAGKGGKTVTCLGIHDDKDHTPCIMLMAYDVSTKWVATLQFGAPCPPVCNKTVHGLKRGDVKR